MQRMTLAAAVLASGGGFLFGQDPPASSRRPGPESADRIVGQVVATDAPRRVLTLRAMSRLPATVATAAPAVPAKPVAERPETFRLTVSEAVSRQLDRYEQGDWVEVTCGKPRARAAGEPPAEATPPPASTGTGARPGTGTTGVGTTGTGISGTGTPPPETTPADDAAARNEGGRAADAAYESPLARWVRERCGLVTAINTPGAAAPTPR